MKEAAESGFPILQWCLIPLVFGTAIWVAAFLVRRVPAIATALQASNPRRVHSIDALRGLLAVAVLTHHGAVTWFYLATTVWTLPPNRLLAQLGQCSVALFFMITAFLFWGRVLDRGGRIDWIDFIASRVIRLCPAYLSMLALVILVTASAALLDGTFTLRDQAAPLVSWLFFTLAGAKSLFGFEETSLLTAGVTWSLRYEWLFYLALPIFSLVAGRSASLAAAALSVIALAFSAYVSGWHYTIEPYTALSFAGGILAAMWVRHPRLLAAAHGPLVPAAGLLALAATIYSCPTAYMPLATAGLTLFFIPVAAGNDFYGVLRHRALLWLGEASYGIYLLHGLCLWLIMRFLLPIVTNPLDPWIYLVAMVVVTVIAVLAASAVFMFVEHPSMQAGRAAWERVRRPRLRAVSLNMPRP